MRISSDVYEAARVFPHFLDTMHSLHTKPTRSFNQQQISNTYIFQIKEKIHFKNVFGNNSAIFELDFRLTNQYQIDISQKPY